MVVESPRQKMGAERRKEVEAIQRAMEEENRRAAGGRSGTEEEIRPQGGLHYSSSVAQVRRSHREGPDSALCSVPRVRADPSGLSSSWFSERSSAREVYRLCGGEAERNQSESRQQAEVNLFSNKTL